MFPYRVEWTPVVLAAMVVACAALGLGAGEDRPEDALAKLGLKRAGDVLVLAAESEVRSQVVEARRLSSQLSRALMQQRGMVSKEEYQATLKELNSQINQARSELNATNQQMRQIPRSPYTRHPNYFANNLAAEQYAELMAHRNQLQEEIKQRTSILGQLRSQPLDS